MQKTCNECCKTKPVVEFYRRGEGYMAKCKVCFGAKYPQSVEYRRKHRYGVTPELYQEMHTKQGGRCATCGGTPDKFYIDHDHACCAGTKSCGGCVRGLLCFNCNTALGQVRDDPRVLLAMVDYLVGAGE